MNFTLGELSKKINGELRGDPSIVIERICAIDDAEAGGLVYVDSPKKISRAEKTPAQALLIPLSAKECVKPAIAVKNPRLALANLLSILHPPLKRKDEIHSSAVIDSISAIGKNVFIGAHAVIEKGAKIGDGCSIGASAIIEENAVIGDGSNIRPNAKILKGSRIGKDCVIGEGTIVGSEGFGYVTGENGEQVHIPQIGIVVIEDNVEIGANTTIDRATLGETRIGRGTKIDNLVHIAHNCRIGESCFIAALVGMAGSVTIGKGTLIGGQAGFKDHVTVGEKCVIAGGAKVWGDVESGLFVSGEPARPHKEHLKMIASLGKLSR